MRTILSALAAILFVSGIVTPAECLAGIPGFGLIPTDAAMVLAQHNAYRCMHQVEPLVWDAGLAATAQVLHL